jgi:sulfate transport system ATP-binding protein
VVPVKRLSQRLLTELRRTPAKEQPNANWSELCETHTARPQFTFELADEVVVMNHGRVEQRGKPDEVFDKPATPFVMDFLGNVNVYHGRVENGRAFWHGVPIDYPDYPHAQARPARVYLRPHELDIARAAPAGEGSLAATVIRQTRTGPITRITCQPSEGGGELHIDLPSASARELALQPGESVSITPRHVRVFLPAPEYVI